MGIWFYLINYTKEEYIFLGRGEPFFDRELKKAVAERGWSLDHRLSLTPDTFEHVIMDIGKRKFLALYHDETSDSFKMDEEDDSE